MRFSSLNLFAKSQNILRLKGRFSNSLLEYEQKYPIISRDYESLFTKLLIVKVRYIKELYLG